METHSHPKKSSWLFVVGGIFLILLFLVAVKFLVAYSPQADEDAARSAERIEAHQKLMAEDKTRLETFAWFDKARGQVQIPIEQAKEMVIAAAAGQKPTAAGPISPLAPAPTDSNASPAPADAAAPATAPAASPQSQNP